MNFRQYLNENGEILNSREPFPKISILADYAIEHNDASVLLVPIMKKLKSFFNYLEMSKNDFTGVRRSSSTKDRDKTNLQFRRMGRGSALAGLTGSHHNSNYYRVSDNTYIYVDRIMWKINKTFQKLAKKEIDSIEILNDIIKDIDILREQIVEEIRNISEEEAVGLIKLLTRFSIQLNRIKSFIEESIPHIERTIKETSKMSFQPKKDILGF